MAILLATAGALGIDYLFAAFDRQRGLGPDAVARRALLAHAATYTLGFVPAFVWLSTRVGLMTLVTVPLVTLPHLIQDERRLLDAYIRGVNHEQPLQDPATEALVDQAFHLTSLFSSRSRTRW